MATIKRLFRSDSVHLEATSGTPKQACDYASKEDTRIPGPSLQFGVPPLGGNGQGKRNDLLLVKGRIDSGEAVLDIAKDDSMFGTIISNERSLQAYAHHQMEPRSTRTRCVVFYGSPGTFKSYAASTFRNRYHVVRPSGKNGQLWFDGYLPNVHDTIVFDDFYGWVQYSLMLELLDRYQCHVQRKGGVVEFRPKLVVLTSNTSPAQWYKYNQTTMVAEAMLRRIDCIFKHEIAEASADSGVSPGDIVISVDKGLFSQHPLSNAFDVLNGDEEHMLLNKKSPLLPSLEDEPLFDFKHFQ